MAERIQLRVFKGCSPKEFRNMFETVVTESGGQITWNTDTHSAGTPCRLRHSDSVHTLWIPYSSGADFRVCKAIGAELNIPWIELRIQEGALWDFNLFKGSENIDNFSTMPEFWEDDSSELSEWKGQPDVLASEWEIPCNKINKYLVHWGFRENSDGTVDHTLSGKAYSTDRYEYGDIWQMLDFLNALGGMYPLNDNKNDHRVRLPLKQTTSSSAQQPSKHWWKFW